MSPHPQLSNRTFIVATLLLLMILACSPLNRWQEFNRQNQAKPTAPTIAKRGDKLNIAQAYHKLETLPGYRWVSQHLVRDSFGSRAQQTLSGEADAQGNVHLLIQYPNGRQQEVYLIGEETFQFDPEYQGWVKLAQPQPVIAMSPADFAPVQQLIQLVTMAGTEPQAVKQENLLNRPVTRYALAVTIEPRGNTAAAPAIDVRGTLWVDDETGAVLKSEIFFYENKDSLPTQEHGLEISAIGNVALITAPTPVINPIAIASATATAQLQLVLPVELNYQGSQINFEIVPKHVSQTPDSSPRSAEMQLVLRQLPESLLLETDIESFLTQLRQHLTLSIPKRNLIVTSSGFRLVDRDVKNRTLYVIYTFNADLEDFSHVELILAGRGNPMFAPVPVE
ncbi:MAG: hypothetical protein JXM69_12820 [Anaerolineae bacterium]|nr:hypothetical protein [Anaerolineae bacterium]